jgi:Zn-dependent alcohol dehydrogenase
VRTRAAVLRQPETEYEIVELEVLDPGPGEVLVEMAYAGLCHSDEHLRHSNPGGRYPIVGGHEGSGVAHTEEATGLARRLSRGTGADVVIVTVGKMSADAYAGAASSLGKGGTLVLTALADRPEDGNVMLGGQLATVFEQRIQGSLFGSCNPFRDIPMLLRLHEEGRLELDRLITRRYSLDEVNQGYRDQAAGETIRGLLDHSRP